MRNCHSPILCLALLGLWLSAPAWSAPPAKPTRPAAQPPAVELSEDPWELYLKEAARRRELEIARWLRKLKMAATDNPWSDDYFQAGRQLIKAYREAGKYQDAARSGEELLEKYHEVIDTKKDIAEALGDTHKKLSEREYVTAQAYAYQRDELTFLLGDLYRQAGQREQAALKYAQVVRSQVQKGTALARKAFGWLERLGWFAVDKEVR